MPVSSSSVVECRTEVASSGDVLIVQRRARRIAESAGLARRRQLEFAIAATEAAQNILDHAGVGSIVLRAVAMSHAELEAKDQGTGIGDVATAVEDNVSRGRNLWGTARKRSLGLGLGAIHRLCDRVSIESGAGGTTLRARKNL